MTSEASQKLVADLKTLATDTQDLIRATAEQTGDKVEAARDRARTALAQAQARVATAEAALSARARLAARNADAYVHGHPWTTVGVVGLCALAIGIVIGRR